MKRWFSLHNCIVAAVTLGFCLSLNCIQGCITSRDSNGVRTVKLDVNAIQSLVALALPIAREAVEAAVEQRGAARQNDLIQAQTWVAVLQSAANTLASGGTLSQVVSDSLGRVLNEMRATGVLDGKMCGLAKVTASITQDSVRAYSGSNGM